MLNQDFKNIFKTLLLITALTVVSSTYATCNDEANKARMENRLDDAMEILNACLDEELSRIARTYLLLGLTHYEHGDHRKSIREYTNAIETAPNYVTAFANRGLSYTEQGDYKKALEDFNEALRLDPEYMQAYYFRAFAHEGKGKHALSIADYSNAILYADDSEELATIYYHRGRAYHQIHDEKSSLADYQQALEINPEYTEVYFSRALAFQQTDQEAAAIADYSRVIELQPDHAQAFYNRGLLYKKAGTDHLAIRDYNNAIKFKPRYTRAYVNRSYAYLIPIIPLLLVLALG